VSGLLYSNGIYAGDVSAVSERGALASAKWVRHRNVTPENRQEAGRELFVMQCSSCHSIGGVMNDILPLTAKYSLFGMDAQLNGMGKLNKYMPPFAGTREERTALASYIVRGLHGRAPDQAGQQARDRGAEPLPFDEKSDEYVLLAWNNLGMHCISDSDRYWTLLPPANDLQAQLILRGELPEVVTEGVTLSYAVEPGFETPAEHVRFWEYEDKLFGTELPENVGLSGNGLSGTMHLDEERNTFEASLVPVVPYPDDGSFNPYPLFFVEARDSETGKLLARTQMVAPTSTEMGCRNCHGGDWRVAGVAGFTDETSRDVLAVHDRINRTDLLSRAEAGDPQLCQSCHADPILGTEGKSGVLGFPAAIHGWHANYLTGRGAESCTSCHPASGAGPTGCQRGVHAGLGLDCTSCHGTLEDHALSLLKKEHALGKGAAGELMAGLTPRQVNSVEEIKGRTPWMQEPDCLTCHEDFYPPESRDVRSFNVWTENAEELYRMRSGEAGIQCQACHGATHAVYPARNIYGRDRDNLQPLQYQDNTLPIGSQENCQVCHTVEMWGEMHHPNSLREFRNVELLGR
jgi:mono/diheme cytochrome c family protein